VVEVDSVDTTPEWLERERLQLHAWIRDVRLVLNASRQARQAMRVLGLSDIPPWGSKGCPAFPLPAQVPNVSLSAVAPRWYRLRRTVEPPAGGKRGFEQVLAGCFAPQVTVRWSWVARRPE